MEIPDQLNPETRPTEMPTKNPKRVEAGKAAAATRKTKAAAAAADVAELRTQLEQLQQLKTIEHDASEPDRAPVAEPGDISQDGGHRVTQEPVVHPQKQPLDWTPWVVGGLGVAAVIYLISINIPRVMKRSEPAASPRASPTVQSAQLNRQLKTRDRFYME